MVGVEWSRFSFSVANGFYALPSDPIDELWIRQAGLSGCESEVFVVSENGIRVRLDEIEFVFGCQAQIRRARNRRFLRARLPESGAAAASVQPLASA